MCLLAPFAKIKFSQKFPNLQYIVFYDENKSQLKTIPLHLSPPGFHISSALLLSFILLYVTSTSHPSTSLFTPLFTFPLFVFSHFVYFVIYTSNFTYFLFIHTLPILSVHQSNHICALQLLLTTSTSIESIFYSIYLSLRLLPLRLPVT